MTPWHYPGSCMNLTQLQTWGQLWFLCKKKLSCNLGLNLAWFIPGHQGVTSSGFKFFTRKLGGENSTVHSQAGLIFTTDKLHSCFRIIHRHKCLILWLHRKSYSYWNTGTSSSDTSCLPPSDSGNRPDTRFWLGVFDTTSFFSAIRKTRDYKGASSETCPVWVWSSTAISGKGSLL